MLPGRSPGHRLMLLLLSCLLLLCSRAHGAAHEVSTAEELQDNIDQAELYIKLISHMNALSLSVTTDCNGDAATDATEALLCVQPTTQSIQGNCSDPAPAIEAGIVMRQLLPQQCVILTNRPLFAVMWGGQRILLEALYLRVHRPQGAQGQVTLVDLGTSAGPNAQGPFAWLSRITFQGDGSAGAKGLRMAGQPVVAHVADSVLANLNAEGGPAIELRNASLTCATCFILQNNDTAAGGGGAVALRGAPAAVELTSATFDSNQPAPVFKDSAEAVVLSSEPLEVQLADGSSVPGTTGERPAQLLDPQAPFVAETREAANAPDEEAGEDGAEVAPVEESESGSGNSAIIAGVVAVVLVVVGILAIITIQCSKDVEIDDYGKGIPDEEMRLAPHPEEAEELTHGDSLHASMTPEKANEAKLAPKQSAQSTQPLPTHMFAPNDTGSASASHLSENDDDVSEDPVGVVAHGMHEIQPMSRNGAAEPYNAEPDARNGRRRGRSVSPVPGDSGNLRPVEGRDTARPRTSSPEAPADAARGRLYELSTGQGARAPRGRGMDGFGQGELPAPAPVPPAQPQRGVQMRELYPTAQGQGPYDQQPPTSEMQPEQMRPSRASSRSPGVHTDSRAGSHITNIDTSGPFGSSVDYSGSLTTAQMDRAAEHVRQGQYVPSDLPPPSAIPEESDSQCSYPAASEGDEDAMKLLLQSLNKSSQVGYHLLDKYRPSNRPQQRRAGRLTVVDFMVNRQTLRTLAVKFYLDQNIFQREREMCWAVRMPSALPTFYEVHENADSTAVAPGGYVFPPFMVMEKGENLVEWVANSTPSFQVLVSALVDIARRLHQLHEAGYAHQDLKPNNVLRMPQDGGWRLVDLSCAAVAGTRGSLNLKNLRYTAPEVVQAATQGKQSIIVDTAVDIWALGVMAMEALCRQPLFPPDTPDALVAECIAGVKLMPWESQSTRPQVLEQLRTLQQSVLKCVTREPMRRPSAIQIMKAWQMVASKA